jgi:hypothetical protein
VVEGRGGGRQQAGRVGGSATQGKALSKHQLGLASMLYQQNISPCTASRGAWTYNIFPQLDVPGYQVDSFVLSLPMYAVCLQMVERLQRRSSHLRATSAARTGGKPRIQWSPVASTTSVNHAHSSRWHRPAQHQGVVWAPQATSSFALPSFSDGLLA